MGQKSKRKYRTIQNPACESQKITVEEVKKAAEEIKKIVKRSSWGASFFIYIWLAMMVK